MPCSSCPNAETAETVPLKQPKIERPTVDDSALGNRFTGSATIAIGDSPDLFVSLAYMLPSGGSFADSYITSLVSKNFLINFEPTFFQIPYIYSAADNLINGNYKKSVEEEGEKIITTYIVPYKRELIDAEATITTYFDKKTNILFYEVPSEFTYNSSEKASVAVTPDGANYIGKILIPASFITLESSIKTYPLTFTIKKDAVPSAAGTGVTATIEVFGGGREGGGCRYTSYNECVNKLSNMGFDNNQILRSCAVCK